MTDTLYQSIAASSIKRTTIAIDILVVITVSGLAYLIEGIAIAEGLLSYGKEIRGVSAMLTGACSAIAIILYRGGSLSDLGLKRPRRWKLLPLQAAIILIVFISAESALPALLSSIFYIPEPDFSRYNTISGNVIAAIGMALILPLTASIPEEIIFRGFLIGRLSKLTEHNKALMWIPVLTQAIIFSLIHFRWGIGGMVMTFIMGVVWGIAYLLCDRNLWTVIFAHSMGHILFVIQLYLSDPLLV